MDDAQPIDPQIPLSHVLGDRDSILDGFGEPPQDLGVEEGFRQLEVCKVCDGRFQGVGKKAPNVAERGVSWGDWKLDETVVLSVDENDVLYGCLRGERMAVSVVLVAIC